MEDVDLVVRLRKRGPPAIVPHAIVTSPRRWERYGLLQCTLRNWAISLAWRLGVPPTVLAQLYYSGSRKQK